jgi:hypothetical protein
MNMIKHAKLNRIEEKRPRALFLLRKALPDWSIWAEAEEVQYD